LKHNPGDQIRQLPLWFCITSQGRIALCQIFLVVLLCLFIELVLIYLKSHCRSPMQDEASAALGLRSYRAQGRARLVLALLPPPLP
jgi:hypothetical protein